MNFSKYFCFLKNIKNSINLVVFSVTSRKDSILIDYVNKTILSNFEFLWMKIYK